MQVNDEYLDELFAHKLGNMEMTPPEDGWLRIEKELNHRSIGLRRYWLAAASFALVLSVIATMVYIQTNRYTTESNNLTAMVINEEPLKQSPELQVQNQTELVNATKETAVNPNRKHETQNTNGEALNEVKPETRNTEPETQNPNGEVLNEVKLETQNSESETFIPEYVDSWDEILRSQPLKPSSRLEQSLNNIQREKMASGSNETVNLPDMPIYHDIAYADVTYPAKSQSQNHWEIAGQFAPMRSYRAISSVPDGLRKSDFDKAEKPLQTYSGGITVAYKLFSRLSVQTGVFYLQMGQSINNVTPVTNMYTTLSSNNSYSKNFVRTSSGNVTVASNVKSDVNTTYSSYFNPESQSATSNSVSMANIAAPVKYRLLERLDYLEIPLIIRYRIIDKKLNLYALGGVSANILIDNNVFVDNGSELVKSGTILMARPVNYSSTVGLGLGYQMTGKLLISLEPSLRYYLQPYTTSSQISSNPYAFGLFTGVVYCF